MKKNLFIYFTSFFCGMSIMAVELSASRLLAPTFGTSSIIWTIIIGIIMISLSLGNVLGGRSADKYNSMDRLFKLIWISAVWIVIIPFAGKYIIAAVPVVIWFIFNNSNILITGSIISCLVIFSIPLVILGMVSPYLVKLGVKDIGSSGKTAGNIYALSTVGSIIGTFIPTFITIPTIGTSRTFLIFGLVLNLICVYYFLIHKRKFIIKAVSSIIILVLIFIPFNDTYAFWKNNIVYEGESLYNYLQVSEDRDSVILSTNVAFGVQSIYKKNSNLSGMYYDYALMGPMFIKNMDFQKPLKTLILGFGTGTYAKQCKRFFPNSNNDGVEIDSKIVDLSKKFFDVKDNEANIFVEDGRTFLNRRDAGKYDLIMVDAYHDITIPFHMSTQEFFNEIKQHLNADGVLLMNINMRTEDRSEAGINDYLAQTVKSTMKKVYRYDLDDSPNTIIFASDNENCRQDFLNNIQRIDNSHPLKQVSNTVAGNLQEITESKLVFTDEVAPVEILGQKVLDSIVNNELGYYKKQIDSSGKGIMGIFDLLD